MALIVTLAMLGLLLLLTLALLSTSQHGLRESHLDSAQIRARLTADSAIAVALSQLRTATEQLDDHGHPVYWVSQPGAIRSFDPTLPQPRLFKLYSAQSMVSSDGTNAATEDLAADWENRPAEFVDLNTPSVDPLSGDLVFPILDPRLKTATPRQSVEGFDYHSGPGAPGGVILPSTQGTNAQRLPMPVRWIYQLQDGTLGTLNPNGRFVSASASQPSRDNPIVSRFAFWTDDESCKVNVNTAAEGVFWDTPRVATVQDYELARRQPTRLEFHRHAGHPAGVCLSSILLPWQRIHPEGFHSAPLASGAPPMHPMPLDDAHDLWRIGRLHIAEYRDGTSDGGRALPSLLHPAAADEPPALKVRQTQYATPSELLFDMAHAQSYPSLWDRSSSDPGRPLHRLFQKHPEALTRLKRAQGLLTAHSTAPETTPFGTPKVILWPVHASTPPPGSPSPPSSDGPLPRYSVYDQKIALLGTLGDQPYFVRRAEPGSGANDMSRNANGQNEALLSYLEHLTARPFPHFPASHTATFATKYGSGPKSDRTTLLTSILDYVRSSNFADGHLPGEVQFSILCPGTPHWGYGQIAPLEPLLSPMQTLTADPPRGHGRIFTISEVALVFTCRAEVGADGRVRGQPSPRNRRALRRPGDREVEVAFLLEGFVPSQGWTDYRPYLSAALVGGTPGAAPDLHAPWPDIRLNGQPLVPPRSGPAVTQSAEHLAHHWTGSAGGVGIRAMTQGIIAAEPVVIPALADGSPPTLELTTQANEPHQWKIALYDSPGAAASGAYGALDLMQVVPLAIPPLPSGTLALPTLAADPIAPAFARRLLNAAQSVSSPLITSHDVVQSLLPLHGDYRLLSSRRWAVDGDPNGPPLFQPHPSWGIRPHAHCLTDPTLPPPADPLAGFIPGLLHAAAAAPEHPLATLGQSGSLRYWDGSQWINRSPTDLMSQFRRDNGARGSSLPHLTGDFDNGVGITPDGAFINRPDDGDWSALRHHQTPFFNATTSPSPTPAIPPVSPGAFAAQRLLPSPVMLGSLPTGVRSQVPWQTLLFRPHPDHYGQQSPPDHLLLELFQAPVIEPVPISRPLETQGKINLNHPLVPFTHIHRSTALHAALKAETLLAIPDSAAPTYKSPSLVDEPWRHYIDAAATLRLIDEKVFQQGRVFATASEICEHPLIPEGIDGTDEAIQAFWSSHRLTGDNTKERPYAHLHPRLTTRSNVFRLHFIAQTLAKARSTAPNVIDLTRDRVLSQVSGTTLLSRHLDAQADDLPNPVADPDSPSLETRYRWHMSAPQYR